MQTKAAKASSIFNERGFLTTVPFVPCPPYVTYDTPTILRKISLGSIEGLIACVACIMSIYNAAYTKYTQKNKSYVVQLVLIAVLGSSDKDHGQIKREIEIALFG